MLENYTIEVFIENYLKDKEVFGEDTKYIYEEIFSDIIGEEVSLTTFDARIENALTSIKYDIIEDIQNNETLTEEEIQNETGMLLELAPMDVAKWINQIKNTPADPAKTLFAAAPNVTSWAKEVGPKGIEKITTKLTAVGGLKGWFSRFKEKVGEFLGGLKGKSFSEILNNGIAWLNNPVNLTKALGSIGGVIIIGMILKALKKRKKMKEYRKIAALAQAGLMKECFEEELNFDGNTKIFAKAKNKIMNECKTNEALRNALFGEEVVTNTKANYFDY